MAFSLIRTIVQVALLPSEGLSFVKFGPTLPPRSVVKFITRIMREISSVQFISRYMRYIYLPIGHKALDMSKIIQLFFALYFIWAPPDSSGTRSPCTTLTDSGPPGHSWVPAWSPAARDRLWRKGSVWAGLEGACPAQERRAGRWPVTHWSHAQVCESSTWLSGRDQYYYS